MKKKLLWIITPILILLALIGTGVGISIGKRPNPNTENRTDEESKIPNQDNENNNVNPTPNEENQKINLPQIITKRDLGTFLENNITEANILLKVKELNSEFKDRDVTSLIVEKFKYTAIIKASSEDSTFKGEVEVRFIPIDQSGAKRSVYNQDQTICEEFGYYKETNGDWRLELFDHSINSVPEELPWFITSLEAAFEDNFNTIIKGLDKWDTSNVTNMALMFNRAEEFNQDISHFNTSNVTDMSAMFYKAFNFNQPLNKWNTSNVTNMSQMFTESKSFNQPLNNWNTSNVTDMSAMFYGAKSFNQPLNNWNTSNVTDMDFMFKSAKSFNQDISSWDVPKCNEFEDFIKDATKMTEDLIPKKFRK
ncbi:Hypothetical protein, predicted transmembrane protein, DUF285 family [Mycoplasma yeatsii 13926]|uniref:PARCEL domain-containing protein n=1 Tax=Mycoplasma yeatsii 13926 TaxID=1188240 RepID=S6G8F4_9MOLU|nr:BspA family leucine-rich repeat surface protein [Mycoplasma yeatsii]EOA07424.1 Hypothetical protein, predicted transmembrane protein, DUF285 family [Mycoplasma yeatsii 13926]